MAATIDGTTGLTAPSGAIFSGIASGTAVASTSGTSIDFTSIPSWVKRITVMFSGVSSNATSNYIVRIGSGSVDTTGYTSATISVNSGASAAFASITSGFNVGTAILTDTFRATVVLTLQNTATNLWTQLSTANGNSNGWSGSGEKTLAGVLDRVRITTVNGTDTFDAGSINILYE